MQSHIRRILDRFNSFCDGAGKDLEPERAKKYFAKLVKQEFPYEPDLYEFTFCSSKIPISTETPKGIRDLLRLALSRSQEYCAICDKSQFAHYGADHNFKVEQE